MTNLSIVRPLLSIRKSRLLATLHAAKIPFADDPSNRDPRFKQILPSSELVGWKRQWPVIPTHRHGSLHYGQLG